MPSSDFRGNQTPSPFFNTTENVPVLIPAYFDMQDNTRDTLIALPGLALVTGHYSEAQRILRCFARYFKRSEEHTSELQSHLNLVSRLLLSKKTSSHPHT